MDITPIGTGDKDQCQSELSEVMTSHSAVGPAERHDKAKKNRSFLFQGYSESVSQRIWPTKKAIILAGETCFLDVGCLIPIIPPLKEPCTRSKSYPPGQSANSRKLTLSCQGSERLLPRRPRINEEQQSVPSSTAKTVSSEGIPKRIVRRSLSVEPALLSVARKRYLKYQGLSTCQLPNPGGLARQRSPVTASKSSSHDDFKEGGHRKLISISELPKSDGCRKIFLRAHLNPRASQAENEELEDWKRRFYEERGTEVYKSENVPEQTPRLQNHQFGNNSMNCIPGDIDIYRQFYAEVFQVLETNQAIHNTKAVVPAVKKYPSAFIQSTNTVVADSKTSARKTSEVPSSCLKKEEPNGGLPDFIGDSEKRKAVESSFEKENVSREAISTSEFPIQSGELPKGAANETARKDCSSAKAGSYQNGMLKCYQGTEYQPEEEVHPSSHPKPEINGDLTTPSEFPIQSGELPKGSENETARKGCSSAKAETASFKRNNNPGKYQNGILEYCQETEYNPEEQVRSSSHPKPEINGNRVAPSGGSDLLLIKKVNRRRHLFLASRQKQAVPSNEQKDEVHIRSTSEASEDQKMTRDVTKSELQTLISNMALGSPLEEHTGKFPSSVTQKEKTLDSLCEKHIGKINSSVTQEDSCWKENDFRLEYQQSCSHLKERTGEEEGQLKDREKIAKANLSLRDKESSCMKNDFPRKGRKSLSPLKERAEGQEKTLHCASVLNVNGNQSSECTDIDDDVFLAVVNKQALSVLPECKRNLGNDNGEKHNKAKSHSQTARERREAICYPPLPTDILPGNIGKDSRFFNYERTPIIENRKNENNTQVTNHYSMIRNRREGTCNSNVSPEEERFLRVIRKRF